MHTIVLRCMLPIERSDKTTWDLAACNDEVPAWQPLGGRHHTRWSYPAMSRHCCPLPPRDADRREGPRSSSTARVPPLLCAFLDLSPLSSRAAILQFAVP